MSFNFLKISCKFLVNEKERWNGLLFTARAIVHDAHHASSFQFHWNQARGGVCEEREKEGMEAFLCCNSAQLDKAPRLSIRIDIWILLSDTETSAATPPGVMQKK